MALIDELKENNRKKEKNNVTIEKKELQSEKLAKKEPVSVRVRAREIRERRIHVDDQNLIGIEQEEGWYYRRFNDTPGRIEKYIKHGYEIVEAPVRAGYQRTKDSSQMGESATQDVGGGLKAYYMRIPMEIWLEDQKKKSLERQQDSEKIASNSLRGQVASKRDQAAFKDYEKKVPGKGVIQSSVSFDNPDEIIA